MQYILTEQEMLDHNEELARLQEEKMRAIGELAEIKGVGACPIASGVVNASRYACHKCPMDNRCDYAAKFNYLPK